LETKGLIKRVGGNAALTIYTRASAAEDEKEVTEKTGKGKTAAAKAQ
jgi:hypothetical protein